MPGGPFVLCITSFARQNFFSKNGEHYSFIQGGGNENGSTTLSDERCVPDARRTRSPYSLLIYDQETVRTALAAGQPQSIQPFGCAASRQSIGTANLRTGGPMKMPFGKYQDVELINVPQPYLRWLRGQKWLGAWLVKAIDDILNGGPAGRAEATDDDSGKPWAGDRNKCGACSVARFGNVGQDILDKMEN
jgi:hypothetical protein